MKYSEHDCEFFEQLLLKQETEELAEAEQQLLEQHLQTCASCQNFQKTLTRAVQGAAFETERELVPGKAVRTELQQAFRARHPQSGTIANLRKFLTYRIPVYQAALTGLVIFLFLFSYQYFFTPERPGFYVEMPLEAGQIASIRQDSVLQQLQSIQKQNLGRNAAEDSTLTRFLISL